MIDVRELRIGAYVYLFRSTSPSRITDIGYSEIEEDRYEAGGISSEAAFRTYVDNLNPIPVTEELLLKCGFSYCETENCFDKLNLRIRILGSSISLFIGTDISFGKQWHDVNIEVKSLHQLQNLYFDLTGKELEVNL